MGPWEEARGVFTAMEASNNIVATLASKDGLCCTDSILKELMSPPLEASTTE